MLGLGETDEEVIEVMHRMREHDIDMLTLGQYLQPSRSHLPVQRFVHPDTFAWFAEEGYKMGFKNVASGPLVRSSYHADQQAHEEDQALSQAQSYACRCAPKGGIGILFVPHALQGAAMNCAETFQPSLPAALPRDACFAIVARRSGAAGYAQGQPVVR